MIFKKIILVLVLSLLFVFVSVVNVLNSFV